MRAFSPSAYGEQGAEDEASRSRRHPSPLDFIAAGIVAPFECVERAVHDSAPRVRALAGDHAETIVRNGSAAVETVDGRKTTEFR